MQRSLFWDRCPFCTGHLKRSTTPPGSYLIVTARCESCGKQESAGTFSLARKKMSSAANQEDFTKGSSLKIMMENSWELLEEKIAKCKAAGFHFKMNRKAHMTHAGVKVYMAVMARM